MARCASCDGEGLTERRPGVFDTCPECLGTRAPRDEALLWLAIWGGVIASCAGVLAILL